MRRNAIVVLLVVFAAGCAGTAPYRPAVGGFKEASSCMIAASRRYIGEANKTFRDEYIDKSVRAQKPLDLPAIYAAQPLSEDEVVLRLDALSELERYGKLLFALASKGDPQSLERGFRSLSASLKDIGTLASSGDEVLSQSLGALSAVFGAVVVQLEAGRSEAALVQAIAAGEGPVHDLMLTLDADITAVYAKKLDLASGQRRAMTEAYNTALGAKKADSELRIRAARVKESLDFYDVLVAADPEPGFRAMEEAHKALVEYAHSPWSGENCIALLNAMEEFTDAARRVWEAARKLKR